MDNILGHKNSGYKVQIPVYEGPMDLLLNLIEHAELEITAVSLAQVTDQYLNYLNGLEETHPEEISAFLVIATKLVLIKSEALLPRPIVRDPGEEDVGQTLIEQLRLYKRFKEIGGLLSDRQEQGLRTYLRVAPPPKVEARLDLSDLTLARLVTAAERVFAREQDKQSLGTVIAPPRITIREKIDLISKTLKRIQHASFRGLLGDKATRLEVVVTFLALLELIKRYRVDVVQENLFGDIEIQMADEWGDDEQIEIEFE